MNNEPSIWSITAEFKNILLKTQKDLKARDERFKKHKNVPEMTEREYQTFYKEKLEFKKGWNNMKTTTKISKNKKQKGARIYCSSNRGNLKAIGRKKIRKKRIKQTFWRR